MLWEFVETVGGLFLSFLILPLIGSDAESFPPGRVRFFNDGGESNEYGKSYGINAESKREWDVSKKYIEVSGNRV